MKQLLFALVGVFALAGDSEAAGRRARYSYSYEARQTPYGFQVRESESFRGPVVPTPTGTALDEVNAARARRGLPPFREDPALTLAAQRAAEFRAARFIHGHVPGGMGDFQFLPPGTAAQAAGCGALEPSWGWGSCCTYEGWSYAGAAVVTGRDGRRYMHLFVR